MANRVDVHNFKLVKSGDSDQERNYTNDILHAIVDQADDLQTQIDDISGGGDVGSNGSFVVVSPEGDLPNARILQGEPSVISITDQGPGQPIEIGISTAGVGAEKLNVTGTPSATTVIADDGTALTYAESVSTLNTWPGDVNITSADASVVIDDSVPGVVDLSVTGGSGVVVDITGGTGIDVDSTSPAHPIVKVKTGATITSNSLTATNSWFTTNFIITTSTGLVNVLNPAGIATASTVIASITSNLTIGGITASTEGRRLTLVNSPFSTANVIINNRAAGGGTTNWFYIGISSGSTNSLILHPGESADLEWHDFGSGESGWLVTAINLVAVLSGIPTPANPTASVGLTAVNGSAATYMRSDAAPALSQSIVPTWTGVHTFTPQAVFTGGLTTGGNVTANINVVALNGEIRAGSISSGRPVGCGTDFGSGELMFMGLIGDSAPPTTGRLFVRDASNQFDAFTFNLSTGAVTNPTAFGMTGIVTPSSLAGTATTNNWNPGLNGAASIVRQAITGVLATRTFTGLVAGYPGQIVILVNISAGAGQRIILSAENASSTAANRFGFSGSITLFPEDAVTMWYDSTSSRWRLLYVPSAVASSVAPIIIDLASDTQSTKFGSATKLTLGRKFFDPTAAKWGLSTSSTATFYALMEVTSGNVAACELYRETGTGSPTVVGTPSTTSSATAVLVSASVTSAFLSTSNSGIFAARCWIGTANSIDEVTCSSAWIEIIP